MPIVRIAASIGVRPQTISEWRAKGRDGRQPYADFAAAVNAAQADLERECLTNIKAAGLDAKNWTANCWILERLHPQAYAAAYYKVRAKSAKQGENAAMKAAPPPPDVAAIVRYLAETRPELLRDALASVELKEEVRQ